MKAVTAVAEILKREGPPFLIGYPVNPIIEAAAEVDIRPIIVRQERTGLHMADAFSRTDLRARSRRVRHAGRPRHRERLRRRRAGLRRVRAAGGHARRLRARRRPTCFPNFNASLNFQHITKSAEQVTDAGAHAGRAAPRLHPGAQRPPAARAWSRSPATSGRRDVPSRSTTSR